jgi:hypothetical protein
MTGQEHYAEAEQLAAKATEYLGQGDGQESAAVWAAVAQVHATLAVAAALKAAPASRERPRIPGIPAPGIVPPGVPGPRFPGVGPLPGP